MNKKIIESIVGMMTREKLLTEKSIDINQNFTDLNGWDSVKQITLVVKLEEEFEVEFSSEQIDKFKNIASIIKVIIEHDNSRA